MRDRDHWDAHDLFPGVRVRMSALGRERHPKYGDRRGVIVSQGSPSSWRVKFDERKTLQAIHRDYLEPVQALPGTDRQTINQASSLNDIAGQYRPDRK